MWNNILKIIVWIISCLVIGFLFSKRSKGILRTIVFTLSYILIAWINVPLCVVLPEGSIPLPFWGIPFQLYYRYGNFYIVAGNILLVIFVFFLEKYTALPENGMCDRKQVNEAYVHFLEDVKDLYIIGRDLDFLKEDFYIKQTKKISKFRKNHCKMLCEYTEDPELLELYHSLIQKEKDIRCYKKSDGITNLTGQIKKNSKGVWEALFVSHDDKGKGQFHILNITNEYLISAIKKQFMETFDNSQNPVIRWIALDLGGTFFDGELYHDFFNVVEENYSVHICKDHNDKTCINEEMMLGKSGIVDYLEKNTGHIFTDKQKQEINDLWSKVWKPNKEIVKIMDELHSAGYIICPFSNLDRNNGDMYLRNNYFYSFSDRHYFSYEMGVVKPKPRAFKYFEQSERSYNEHIKPYEILLIDDQEDNIRAAQKAGWDAIKFSLEQENVDSLKRKLKEKGIF